MRRIVADLLSILAPVLIFAAGAACVAGMTLLEPLAPLEPDALTYILHFTIGAACSVWMSTTALAAKEFFRARRHIFGSTPPSSRGPGAFPLASLNYRVVVPAVETQALS